MTTVTEVTPTGGSPGSPTPPPPVREQGHTGMTAITDRNSIVLDLRHHHLQVNKDTKVYKGMTTVTEVTPKGGRPGFPTPALVSKL